MNITDSVLTSIKKLLGIAEEYEHFDADLIMHINSVFSILTQLGVGPSKGFMIEDKNATWKDFISDESKYMLVKSYMHLKVKLLFDPPLSSAVLDCFFFYFLLYIVQYVDNQLVICNYLPMQKC